MYGIVLWSGDGGDKAVIWCEDHGDLAFFNGPVPSTPLEVGDLVRFNAERCRSMRRAIDLERVAEDSFPGIVDAVRRTARPASDARRGHVVAFPVASAEVRAAS